MIEIDDISTWPQAIAFIFKCLTLIAIIYCLARCTAGPSWFGHDVSAPSVEKKL